MAELDQESCRYFESLAAPINLASLSAPLMLSVVLSLRLPHSIIYAADSATCSSAKLSFHTILAAILAVQRAFDEPENAQKMAAAKAEGLLIISVEILSIPALISPSTPSLHLPDQSPNSLV